VETLGGAHGFRNIISTDSRFVAFQVARTADEAGVGYGIMIYRFR
jgi:hypothetical protein